MDFCFNKKTRTKKTTTLDCSNWNILRWGGHNFRVLPAAALYLCRSRSFPSCFRPDTRCTSCPSPPSCRSTGPTSARSRRAPSPWRRSCTLPNGEKEREKEIQLCSIFKSKATTGAGEHNTQRISLLQRRDSRAFGFAAPHGGNVGGGWRHLGGEGGGVGSEGGGQ